MPIEELLQLVGRCAARPSAGSPPLDWTALATQIREDAHLLLRSYETSLHTRYTPLREVHESIAVGVALQLAILTARALANHPLLRRSPLAFPRKVDEYAVPLQGSNGPYGGIWLLTKTSSPLQ
jgi:hypothetical protein